jgi:hypothetical protein
MSDFARAQEELIALRAEMARMREDFREIINLAGDKAGAANHKQMGEIARRNVEPDKPV